MSRTRSSRAFRTQNHPQCAWVQLMALSLTHGNELTAKEHGQLTFDRSRRQRTPGRIALETKKIRKRRGSKARRQAERMSKRKIVSADVFHALKRHQEKQPGGPVLCGTEHSGQCDCFRPNLVCVSHNGDCETGICTSRRLLRAVERRMRLRRRRRVVHHKKPHAGCACARRH